MAYNGINVNFVKQYGKTLDLLTQTKGGKFTGKCLEDTITGERAFYDQLGSVTATTATRSGGSGANPTGIASPLNDISHERRSVTATPYDVGLLLDRFDKVEMLVNPESEYTQQQVAALMRKKDIEFLKGTLGTAHTGKDGTGTAHFNTTDAGNQFLELGTGDAAGFTLAKLIEARAVLQAAGVDLEDPMNTAYVAITPTQLHNLLKEEKVTSTDYAAVKALVRGELDSFYGFQFCVSNLLPWMNTAGTAAYLEWNDDGSHTSTNDGDVPKKEGAADTTKACFAWVKSGVRQVTNPSIETEVTKRSDLRFNYYAYSSMRTGAVRMEEVKVVAIPCEEA